MNDQLIEKNNIAADEYMSDRRSFLRHGLLATAVLGFWTPALGHAAPATARRVKLVNQHTGEKFIGEYWYNGKYLPDAFNDIKMLMRDHRTNERFPIDPRLMDILYVLSSRLNMATPFNVISGYRSPKSNAMLSRSTEGVARNSLHMSGQAIDLRVQGMKLTNLRDSALRLKAGGVGYYGRSNFVHIDTGRVRSW
jgi:uncharacterized protein YcbK (DUF882 family)